MQSNKINVLMISYGRGALYENKAGVLDRHIEYASHFESLEILYLTRKKLENLNFGKLNVTPVFGLSYLICLFKSLFKNFKNYQVVTTQDPFLTGILGLFYKKRFGIKLHVQNHSNFIDNKHWIKENRLRNSILNYISKKIIIPNADRLRVVNSYEKNLYIKNINIDKNKIDIAPIAVNPIFYKKLIKTHENEFKRKHKILDKKFKIGWAGRFVRLKRLDYLFELVSSISKQLDTQLILAGDNNNSDFELKKLENKNILTPVYTGQLSQNELVKFYNSLDVFVLTSEYEGYGMVLAEALTVGCPVLVWEKSKGSLDIINKNANAFTFKDKLDFENQINLIKKELYKSERIIKPEAKNIVVESIFKTIQ
ncbi:glycosyltransferase [Flavobacteriaceae bacterium]|nr:glycosyltransferase [Flavobacteriaceae bacterium]